MRTSTNRIRSMRPTALAWLALAWPLIGCSAAGDLPGQESYAAVDGEQQPEGTSLDQLFADAAAEFDVPAAILESVAWVETQWQMVRGESEFDGVAPAFGVMALRGAALESGAQAAGLDIDAVRNDLRSNIRAAAALMSELADEHGIDRADLGDWAPVVAEYSGIEDEQGQALYVHEEVYHVLQTGVVTELGVIEPHEVQAHFAKLSQALAPGPDYDAAVWRPSPNHSSRPSGNKGKRQMVIIHTCDGGYSGCHSWLRNPSAKVSAHYVVNSSGSEISQLVREYRKAWHCAATYKCSRNSNHLCELQGTGCNNFTIGIEHAGYAETTNWQGSMIDASAQLVCDITADNSIPRDQFHIVGHGQVQPYNRIDPGPNWPWTSYLDKINAYCGSSPPPTDPPPNDPPPTDPPPNDPPPNDSGMVVIDSNNNANGGDAEIVVSGNWTASNNVSGYYNTGYWWRKTGPTSDLAEFRVHLPSDGPRIVEAWWPAASDRSHTAPFIIYDGQGDQLDVVYVDQQSQGGQWVQLGTYNLTAGWNVVALSRWTTSGKVVVADAVRVRNAN